MDRRALLLESLEELSGREAELVERFYENFFARHPELRELFGEHGVSEREEMIRETLSSLLAWLENEPWLGENLEAMGRSHAEYGVEAYMYPRFVDALLDTLEEMAGVRWTPACRQAWREGLTALTGTMARAGESGRA